MYPISNFFSNFFRKTERYFIAKCEVNGVEYGDSVMVEFAIENSLSLSNELELGTAIPSKLTIKFRMLEQFPPNARIVPYVTINAGNLSWEDADFAWEDADISWEGVVSDWLPLGEFFIDRRERIGDLWTYVCYDKLIFGDVPYISSISYPTTMQAVWDEVCTKLNFPYDESVQINPSYTISVAPTGYSMRNVMMFISAAHAACAYIDKAGTLKWRSIRADEQAVFDLGLSEIMRVKQTNPVKSYSRVVVHYDTEDDLFFEAGTGGDGNTMFVICPFATQQIADDILAAINGYSYQPVSLTPKGFPQLEQGDRLSFVVQNNITWEDADISWEDADFSWDGQSFHETLILHQELVYRGGFSMQIEAPSISEQQSEFVVEGTIEGQIGRINKTVVKQEKNYYGFSVSKDYGAMVERSDGLAKAVWNADEFTFYSNGQKALWFDVPNKRYKFTGTLEGVDGVFTGTLQAGTVNSSNINGGIMTGSTIIGSFITTNLTAQKRVELSSTNNLIKVRGSDTAYIDFESSPYLLDSPAIKFYYGSSRTDIFQVGNLLSIVTNTGNVRVDATNITLSGNVNVGGDYNLGALTAPYATSPEDAPMSVNAVITALKRMKILA